MSLLSHLIASGYVRSNEQDIPNDIIVIVIAYFKDVFHIPIDIAILQLKPIESEDYQTNLASNTEMNNLKNILFKTTRGLNVFIGVLTENALINCIQKGAQIIHISGHPPNENKIKVEDEHSRLNDLNIINMKKAIQYTGNQYNGSSLKLVFISTSHPQKIAQQLSDGGVPHIVSVYSKTTILDKIGLQFVSIFYESLLVDTKSVQEAFDKSKDELLLHVNEEDNKQCECGQCAICKLYNCCPPSPDFKSLCNINDRFSLSPKFKIHSCRILSFLPNKPCKYVNDIIPTNIGPPKEITIGRDRNIRVVTDFLTQNGYNVTCIHRMSSQIGLTSVALDVAHNFIRTRHKPIFRGGVYRIDLRNYHDPNCLYSLIAQAVCGESGDKCDNEQQLSDINKCGINTIYGKYDIEQKHNKLFIIDHINFHNDKTNLKQFTDKIETLINSVKCKVLLVLDVGVNWHDVEICNMNNRVWRIGYMNKKYAAKALLYQSRHLQQFDFRDMDIPETIDQFSDLNLFKYLSWSPSLIRQCSNALNTKIPFCVINKMMNEKPNKWKYALKDWDELELEKDKENDALNSLILLLTHISATKLRHDDLNV